MVTISIILIIFFTLFLIIDYKKALKFFLFIYFLLPQSVALINIQGLPLISLHRISILLIVMFYFIYKRRIDNVFNLSYDKLPYLDSVLLLYLGYLIISLNSDQLIKDSLIYTHAFIFDNIAVVYIIYRTFNSPKDISRIINTVIIAFLIISIYGVFTWIFDANPFIDFVNASTKEGYRKLIINYNEDIRAGIYGRVQSTFYHPISYGAHLAMVFSLVLYQLHSGNKKLKLLYLIVTVFIILNIIITSSRSPFIFMLIVILPHLIKFEKNLILLIGIPLLFLIIVEILPQLLKIGYFDTIISAVTLGSSDKEHFVGGSSIDNRILQLAVSLNYFNLNPLTGMGATKIRETITFQQDPELAGAESFLFELLIETGIIGFIIFGFLFAKLIFLFLKIRNKSDTGLKYISNLGLSLVIGYLVFIITIGKMGTMFFFFFVITIYFMITRSKTCTLNG